jgi:hypothetical protein
VLSFVWDQEINQEKSGISLWHSRWLGHCKGLKKKIIHDTEKSKVIHVQKSQMAKNHDIFILRNFRFFSSTLTKQKERLIGSFTNVIITHLGMLPDSRLESDSITRFSRQHVNKELKLPRIISTH